MREFGKIITRKTDLTDAQVQEKYKFPAIIILHDNEDHILKITHYQKNGTKTIYDFSLSASKQFVTDSIATAIAGLQDNRLEFNEFSDFPAIGDETKFYIDLTEDKIYIWDAYSQTYKNQSWDTATIAFLQASIASAQMAFQNLQNSKLDKGNYTGTAKNLKDEIEQKVNLKIFRSFNDFPPVHTLDSIENTNDFYLDRYTGEIFIVMYERAVVDDPGMNLAYKKI